MSSKVEIGKDVKLSGSVIIGGIPQGQDSYQIEGDISIEGVVRTFYNNGMLYSETLYKNGKIEGVARAYYDNGKPLSETPYIDGSISGIEKRYHTNGKIEYETPYINGVKSGIEKTYSERGKLLKETPYVNDIIEGIEKRYDEKGRIEQESPYINGEVEGIEKVYEKGELVRESVYAGGVRNGLEKLYIYGTLYREEHYKDGEQEGITKEYYKTGGLKLESTYKDGEKNGIEIEYDRGGQVVRKMPYKDDMLNGLVEYYENGRLNSETPYKMGEIHGIVKYYRRNGRLKSEVGYKSGDKTGYEKTYEDERVEEPEERQEAKEEVKRIYYDKQKTLLKEEIPYKNNQIEGIRKKYDKSGALISEETYKNGVSDGIYRGYEDGELSYIADYKDNNLHGFTVGFDSGQLSYISSYNNGKEDGLHEHYVTGESFLPATLMYREIYENGVLLRRTYYANGMKNGEERWFNKSKTIRVAIYNDGELTAAKGEDVSKLGAKYDFAAYSNRDYRKSLNLKSEIEIETPCYGVTETWVIPCVGGLAEGVAKGYYAGTDRIKTAALYKAGVKDGIERTFYYSGKLASETPFKDGVKDGAVKFYPNGALPMRAVNFFFPNISVGKPKKEVLFRNGIKNGLKESELDSAEIDYPVNDDEYYEEE
jgi:antitoxin component YwqK of YwqJK toxin-antitoxin module